MVVQHGRLKYRRMANIKCKLSCHSLTNDLDNINRMKSYIGGGSLTCNVSDSKKMKEVER